MARRRRGIGRLFKRSDDPQLIERQGDIGRAIAVQDIDWSDPANVEEDEFAAFVCSQFLLGKQRRQAWEGQAAEQLAWARGNQHLIWNEETRDLVKLVLADKPLEFRDPVHINKIKPIVLTFIGMIVGQPLIWTARPATRDDDDVAGAKTLSKLLAYYWVHGHHQQRKIIDMLWAVCCTGIGFIKPLWDPTLGEADRFTSDVLLDEDAENPPESRRQRKKLHQQFTALLERYNKKPDEEGGIDLPRGDLAVDFPTGFDITEPEMAKDMASCGWLIESRFRSIEYVRERYGETVAPTDPTTWRKWQTFEQYGDYYAYTGRTGQHLPAEDVLVHEFWRPRSQSAPYGFRGVCTEAGKVLFMGRHPYAHGLLPYIRVTEMPEPEHFRPGCTVRDLMGLQRARNKQRSMLHGHLETCVDPRVLAPKAAQIADDAFLRGPKKITVHGEIDTSQIRPMQMPTPPAYMAELDQMNARDMEDVAGVHRSTTGKMESSQQSGRHAEIMRQQDSRRLSVLKQIVQEAFGEAGQQMAWLLWEFVTTERAVTITGANRRGQVVKFKGSELSKNRPFGPYAFNIRVDIQAEPDLELVYNRIDVLAKSGFISPERENDRIKVQRWIGEVVPDELDENADHRQNAQDENDVIAAGAPIRAAYGDHDGVHIEEHMHFTTTGAFRRARVENPEIEIIMRMHIRDHLYNKADKEFRPIALAKRVQADLIKEYRLMPPAPTQPGGPGGPAGPVRALPGQGAGPPGPGGMDRPGAAGMVSTGRPGGI